MLTFLQRKGVRLVRCEGYSDYYPNAKGGNARGRSVEGVPFDARQLGEWHDKLQPSLAKGYGLAVKTNELRSVQYFNRSPQAFATAARVFLRTKAGTLRRQELLTNGASLMGQMLKALIDLAGAPPVWTNTAMDDLVVEDGRVCRRPGDERRRAGPHRGSEGSAARGGRLRAQRRDATQVQRESAERGAVVDRERGRHRRSARDGDAAGRQDRPARRGVVASVDRVARSRPRRSSPRGNVRARSSSTRPGNGSATSRTPMSRWARRCTRTRRCPAGSSSTRAIAASTRRRRTRSNAGCRRRPSRAARCGGRTRSRSWRARSASTPTGWCARCNGSTSTR